MKNFTKPSPPSGNQTKQQSLWKQMMGAGPWVRPVAILLGALAALFVLNLLFPDILRWVEDSIEILFW